MKWTVEKIVARAATFANRMGFDDEGDVAPVVLEIRAVMQQVRNDTIEEACKAVCDFCKVEILHDRSPDVYPCKPIRVHFKGEAT